jgi:hypothetical protein
VCALRRLQREQPPGPYVFASERGGPIAPKSFHTLISRLGERCTYYRVVTGDVAGSRANYDKYWITVETARYLPEHVQFREHVREPHTGDDIVSDPDVVETDGSD